MKKVTFIIITLLMILSVVPVQAEELQDVDISAEYAIVIDRKQDTILYEKNTDEKMYPASMTKVITSIVALEMIPDLDETLTITQADVEGFQIDASVASFEVGEVVTYRDLLYGAMMPSGADATQALANHLCNNPAEFIAKMNALSDTLDLKNSNFVNTTGLHDDNHYTTIDDLVKIIKYAMKNEDFMTLFTDESYTTSNGKHRWGSGAKYHARTEGIDTSAIIGCKSGFTDEGLNCLLSLSEIEGREAIIIVGHSEESGIEETNTAAVIDTNTLISYIGEQYEEIPVHKAGDTIKIIPIKYGEKELYTFTYMEDVMLYLPTSQDKEAVNENFKGLTIDREVSELEAPVEEGTNAGKVKVTYNDQEIYAQDLIVEEKISKDIFDFVLAKTWSFIFPWGLSIVFIIIFIVICLPERKKKISK